MSFRPIATRNINQKLFEKKQQQPMFIKYSQQNAQYAPKIQQPQFQQPQFQQQQFQQPQFEHQQHQQQFQQQQFQQPQSQQLQFQHPQYQYKRQNYQIKSNEDLYNRKMVTNFIDRSAINSRLTEQKNVVNNMQYTHVQNAQQHNAVNQHLVNNYIRPQNSKYVNEKKKINYFNKYQTDDTMLNKYSNMYKKTSNNLYKKD